MKLYPRWSAGTTGDSRCCRDEDFLKKIRLIAGVTVSATTIDASNARAYDVASGRKNDPDSPSSRKIGVTATISISVAYTIALRTSSEASRMILAVETPLPSRRCCRRRRTTFSISMIASSTMSPRAITIPARIMVLIVAPRQCRTSPAAINDKGIATTLITAVRQLYRKRQSIRIIRIAPSQMALERLLIDSSMNVAGRKIVESIAMPGRPGLSSSSAASTPRVTSRVFAHGSFSTMSIRP